MINEKLMELAKTIPMKRLAFELDEVSELLRDNYQLLINLEFKNNLTIDEKNEKARLIDIIAKLILKL
jgi:hypothetical protein